MTNGVEMHDQDKRMPDLTEAAERLRRRFLANRPLRTASLIVTLFGDAIVPRGGELSIRALIDLAGDLGVEAGAVRTAMSRLGAEGLFVRGRGGRRPRYRLSADAERTFAEAFRRVYAGERPAGGDGFTIVVMPAAAKREVDAEALQRAGFRPWLPGLHVAPASAGPVALPAGAFRLEGAADAETTRRIATEVLGGAAATEGYRQFVRDHADLTEAAGNGRAIVPADAFAVRTLAIHAFRRIVVRDPGLPEGLMPPDRPDLAARRLMAGLYGQLAEASERHLDAVAAHDDEALRPLAIDLPARFRCP